MRRLNYGNMYKWVSGKRGLSSALRLIDRISVAFTVASYILLLVFSFIGSSYLLTLRYIAVSGVPFVILSIVRRAVNSPRPCEVYDLGSFGLDHPGGKRGESMPSRHVFSSFIIGTLLCAELPVLGALVLLSGVGIGACRVLRGIHFVKDCVVGAAVGAACGIIGVIIVLI